MLCLKELKLSLLSIAFFAKHRLAFLWLEWNFAFLPTFRACCFMHFAWSAKISSEATAIAASVKISHFLSSNFFHKRIPFQRSLVAFLCLCTESRALFKNVINNFYIFPFLRKIYGVFRFTPFSQICISFCMASYCYSYYYVEYCCLLAAL